MFNKNESLRGYPDKPVESIQSDLFNVESYVKGLCSFIDTCDTPMTISIQGDWGSGKTSIMNMLRENLEGSVYPIWFNTWQFSQFQMGNGLAFSMLDVMMKGLDKGNNLISDFARKAFGFARAAAVFATDVMVSGKAADLVEGATNIEKEMDYASEILKLRDSFQEAINKKLAETHRSRVVIFVDDLDRLQPGKAVELLEVLKLFLDCENCVFVLAVDYNVVTMGIKEKYGASVSEEKGRSFFDKIIQLPFKLPVAKYDVDNYVQTMMTRMSIDTEQNKVNIFVDLIRTSIGFNPRGMKRLFNTYQLLEIITRSNRASMDDAVRQRILFGIICMQMKFEELYNHLVALKLNAEIMKDFIDGDTSVYADLFGWQSDNLQPEQTDKIQRVQLFMQKFIAALQIDDDEALSEEEIRNLSVMLQSSTVTSIGSESNAESDNGYAKRMFNKGIIDNVISKLADINDKKKRYMPNSKNNVWSSYVSMVIEFESKNNLWMHFECGIEFVDDNNIGISMYLYSYSNRRGEKYYKDVIAEFGENPYGYDTMPEKFWDDGIVYRNIRTVYKHDEFAPNTIAEFILNAYNSVRNK